MFQANQCYGNLKIQYWTFNGLFTFVILAKTEPSQHTLDSLAHLTTSGQWNKTASTNRDVRWMNGCPIDNLSCDVPPSQVNLWRASPLSSTQTLHAGAGKFPVADRRPGFMANILSKPQTYQRWETWQTRCKQCPYNYHKTLAWL